MSTTVKVIIGANYGDEGKGLMTDYFCNEAVSNGKKCLNILTNGTSQRSHTVELSDGSRHAFQHFGSGTWAGADTYFSSSFTLNPMQFIKEYEEIKPKINIYCDTKCMILTPYDIILNQILEESRGENKHGSCGSGYWESIKRNREKSFFLFKCMLNKTYIKEYLDWNRQYFFEKIDEYNIRIPEVGWEIFTNEKVWNSIIENYIQDIIDMTNLVIFTDYSTTLFNKYDYLVFENGQGLLLDEHFGNHATPSKTGLDSCIDLIERIDNSEVEVVYVTRTYLTRHGAGDFPEECDVSEINPSIYDETNVVNEFQGAIRYGKLNQYELFRRVMNDFVKNSKNVYSNISIAVTHTNEYPVFDDTSLVGYVSNGKTRESVSVLFRKD